MECKVCGREFTPRHFNQKICSEECKIQARRDAKNKYKRSDKGKASTERWHKSERFKANEKVYRQKPEARRKAVIRAKRYLRGHPEALEKKRERDKAFGKTERGREINKIASKKYRQSEKGKLKSRISHYNCRGIGAIDKTYLAELLKGNVCYYCGKVIDGKKTIDHKTPTSRNGTNANNNIVLACVHCNSQKSNKTELEYKEWLNDKNNMRMRTYGRV